MVVDGKVGEGAAFGCHEDRLTVDENKKRRGKFPRRISSLCLRAKSVYF